MISEIVPARRYHCGQISRLLRDQQAQVILHAGRKPHHDLRRAYDASSFRASWLIDGKLMAMGGLTGSILSPEGFLWLAISKEAEEEHPIATARAARYQVEAMLEKKERLYVSVLKDDRKSVALCYSLRFLHERDLDGPEIGDVKAALMCRKRD